MRLFSRVKEIQERGHRWKKKLLRKLTMTARPTEPMVKMMRGMRSLLTVSQRVIQPRRRMRKVRKVEMLRRALVR